MLGKTKVKYTFLKFPTSSDVIIRKIPYMEIDSGLPGPLVYITACVHGDEVGGVAVLQDLFRVLRRQGIAKGKLCALPLMNPFSFEFARRTLPHTEEDLNRKFPGNPDGGFGERIADQIFQKIVAEKPDLVIDLHNDWIRSVPYAVIEPKAELYAETVRAKSLEMALESGLLVLTDAKPVLGSLTTSLLQQNIPAVTLELGESFVVNEKNLQIGLQTILNILKYMQMVEKSHNPYVFPVFSQAYPFGAVYEYYENPLPRTSGILRSHRVPGQVIKEGEFLGQVVNTFGRNLEKLRAQKTGVLLGLNDSFVSFPGKPIFAFAIKQ